MMVTSAY